MIVADPRKPRGIVWIASYPKSGNTWMRVFLYHMQRLMAGLPREENDLHHLDRSSTYEARLFGLFEQYLGKPLATATREDVAQIRPQVQATIAQRTDGVALIKTHNVLGQLGGVPIINMQVSAGTIYIVRDPRDVALSLANHIGAPIDEAITVLNTPAYGTQNTTEAAFEIWGSWSEHTLSWTMRPHDAVLVVRYEDMIADPVGAFTTVARHLRQKPTTELVTEASNLSGFSELREQEAKVPFRERSEAAEVFFREGRAGEWREKLTADQARRIVDAHGEQMQKFGYLPS
jgi:hypothetical protein